MGTIVENFHNVGEDGSYSYGWRSSDGSFKKETRLATGEVSGEYGYKDAAGDIITTRYGVNTDTQFGFKVLSEKRKNTKARRKIVRKEEEEKELISESSEIVEKEDNEIETNTNNIVKPNHKMIDGRKAVINNRARQLLTKEDIIKNRKAFINKTAKQFLEKIDNIKKVEDIAEVDEGKTTETDKKVESRVEGKTMMINGKKVKIVRKARKQLLKNKNTSTETQEDSKKKILKDKKNNRLQIKSDENRIEKFNIQMTLPHPMLMKPRVSETPRSGVTLSDSKVPYYTAFIQSRGQAERNRQRLSGNLL